MISIERVMQVMTHVAIGVALGMALWIVWSGLQVVSGERPLRRAGDARTAPAAPQSVSRQPRQGAIPVSLPC